MTVKELIEKLQKRPQNEKVVVQFAVESGRGLVGGFDDEPVVRESSYSNLNEISQNGTVYPGPKGTRVTLLVVESEEYFYE